MEWSNDTNKFERSLPRPSPVIDVEASVLTDVHQKYGVKCNAIYPTVSIQAVTDTGCQTTTAGVGILKMLNMTKEDLIPTKHKIIGITENSLNIIGVLMLTLEHRGRTAKQMVYISTRPCGLYLSETALIELGLIDENFPNYNTPNAATIKSPEQCHCFQRSEAPEKPDTIPYAPTKENVPKLKEWLLKRFASSGFNKCTHQELGTMTGVPMDIHFKEDATPHAVHTPIPVPLHWRYRVKEDLDRDVRLGIIEKVPQGTPVKWCSRMVVTAKKDMTPRRTVDLQKLKKATLRETHYTRTPFHIVSQTPKRVLKTALDAWNGYHSLLLSDSARDATTFITEWGRYRYKRAPMGHHSSGDAYTRRFDDITSGFDRVNRCVDDSLLWDDDVQGAFWHTYDYIKLCADNGIVFNPEKFVFAEEICEFAGFEITMDGYRPTKKILESIRSFPKPTNIHDIRAWFGLVNQVAYAFVQTSQMSPFRDLLKKKSPRFYWDDALDQAFEQSKQKILELIEDGVKTFEMNKVTCVATDYSKMGIGYTLLQKNCNCPKPYTPTCGGGHWDLIMAGSRFTTPTEARYAPIEGEALAAAYGLNQCKHFVLGCPELVLATDHKPLTKILNDRELDTIENPRLLRMKEKTLRYNFDIVHVAGKLNQAPDAFSRYPRIPEKGELIEDDPDDNASKAFALYQSSSLPSSISWQKVNSEAAADSECVGLKEVIEAGFPEHKSQLPEHLKYFWCMKDDIYMIDHVPFKGRKMLIPKSLRRQIVEGLHSGHQGVSSMSANARERLFWPRLDADLRQAREQCRKCNEIAPSLPAETLLETPDPEMPFEQVATDLFKIGAHSYLVYADRFSGWTEAKRPATQSFKSIKKCFLGWFKTFGVPDEISADGGPPFQSSEYKSFLKTWDITARLSSAYYPQNNGRAEVAVKSMKRTLLGNIDPTTGELDTEAATRAILAQCNTPTQQSKLSPSELVFGHKIRDHLPNKFRKMRTSWRRFRMAKEIKNRIRTTKVPADNSRTHKPFVIGEHVSIQNQHGNKPKRWSNTGKVVEVLPHRKYQVMIDGSKRLTLRNRKFLRRIPAIARDGDEPPLARTFPQIPSPAAPRSTPQAQVEMKQSTPTFRKGQVEEVCSPPSVRTPARRMDQTGLPSTPIGRDGGQTIPMASTPRADAPSFRLPPQEIDAPPEAAHRPETMPEPIQQPTAIPSIEPDIGPDKAPDNLNGTLKRAANVPQAVRRSTRTKRRPVRLVEE